MINYFFGDRSLTENWSNNNGFCLGQNVGIESKALERMLRNPMKTIREIRKSKITCRFNLRTFKFYGKQMLRKREDQVNI
jgi:hypothetical protein